MGRSFSKISLSIAAAMLLSMLVSVQTFAAPNPAAATSQRTTASQQAAQAKGLLTTAEKLNAGDTKAAALAQAQALKAIADARLELADGYEAGDNEAIKSATAKINEASVTYSVASRVVTARRNADTWGDTSPHASWEKSTVPAVQPQLAAFLSARKDAAEKWTAMAELGATTSDNETLSVAEEVAMMAGYEANIASRAWSYAREMAARRDIAAKKNSGALTAQLDAIEKQQAQVLANLRTQYEATIADRKLHREHNDLIAAFDAEARKK